MLKPGGRIAISDVALRKELPEKIRNSIEAYTGCVAGAILIDDYKKIVKAVGFKDVKFTVKGSSCCGDTGTKDDVGDSTSSVVSVYVEARK